MISAIGNSLDLYNGCILPSDLVFQVSCFTRGKYLARKAVFNSFHVVIEFDRRDCSHTLALFLRENWKSRSRIASRSTPLLFSVSANCTNTDMYKFGSSV